MLKKASKFLMVYALFIPPVMITVFIILNKIFSKPLGYFIPYTIYLCILLVGIILFGNEKRIAEDVSVDKKTKKRWIYYFLSFVPVIATFIIAFLPVVAFVSLRFMLIVSFYACINGSLEELFWRGTFSKIYGRNLAKAYIIPTIIFTCWHFSLLFAQNVSYHGGALALVGGACVMGFIWGLTVFKTKNIKVVIAAHILVNICAFSQLLFENSLI